MLGSANKFVQLRLRESFSRFEAVTLLSHHHHHPRIENCSYHLQRLSYHSDWDTTTTSDGEYNEVISGIFKEVEYDTKTLRKNFRSIVVFYLSPFLCFFYFPHICEFSCTCANNNAYLQCVVLPLKLMVSQSVSPIFTCAAPHPSRYYPVPSHKYKQLTKVATWHSIPPHACALSYFPTDIFMCNPREYWKRQEQKDNCSGLQAEVLEKLAIWNLSQVWSKVDGWMAWVSWAHIHRLMVRMNCNNFLIDLLPRLDRGISLRVVRRVPAISLAPQSQTDSCV